MRAFAHHKNVEECPGCKDRLKDAHPSLCLWFWKMRSLQAATESMLHVSWAFRDEGSQNEAFKAGASKLQWPKSKHNTTQGGYPCSEALDVFQINGVGQAIFDPIFCARLNAASKKLGFDLRWGGEFKTLGDSGHFELI